MGTSSSTAISSDQYLKDTYLGQGVTEQEFERILQAYRLLQINPSDGEEVISKRKLRRANYLTRNEIEAIQKGEVKQYMDHQLNHFGSLELYRQSNDGNLNLEASEIYSQRMESQNLVAFEQTMHQDAIKTGAPHGLTQNYIEEEHYQPWQKQIDTFEKTKFETSKGMTSYSCTCTNAGYVDKDEIKLTFEDFYELMSQKIIQQKRSSSLHTVFESRTENVSCILWPSFSGGSQRRTSNKFQEGISVDPNMIQGRRASQLSAYSEIQSPNSIIEAQKNDSHSHHNNQQYQIELNNRGDEAPQLVAAYTAIDKSIEDGNSGYLQQNNDDKGSSFEHQQAIQL